MLRDKSFSLEVGQRHVHGVYRASETTGRRPTVIICHGFKGFMDWGFFPYLAELLAERGFCTVRFNFSGSGMSPGDEIVTDPEAFRTATFSKDLRELRAVLEAVGRTIAPNRADPERVAILGHSRGGGTALLAAADSESLRALVTWAAVATFDRMPAADRDRWRTAGEIPVVNARTGQELAIGSEVLDDLDDNAATLDLETAASRRSAPWLIVHGDEDETVPIAEARRLHQAASEPAKLQSIRGASHTFGVGHPFRRPTPELIEAMNETLRWLRRYVSADSS